MNKKDWKYHKDFNRGFIDDFGTNPITIEILNKLHMKDSNYDEEGNAKHYDTERVNSIILLERAYGTYETMIFCEMNALKYRLRIGKKQGVHIEQELLKAKWYENAAHYFFGKINTSDQIVSMTSKRQPLPWKTGPNDHE